MVRENRTHAYSRNKQSIDRIRVLVTFSHWDFPFYMEVFPGVILSLLHS